MTASVCAESICDCAGDGIFREPSSSYFHPTIIAWGTTLADAEEALGGEDNTQFRRCCESFSRAPFDLVDQEIAQRRGVKHGCWLRGKAFEQSQQRGVCRERQHVHVSRSGRQPSGREGKAPQSWRAQGSESRDPSSPVDWLVIRRTSSIG